MRAGPLSRVPFFPVLIAAYPLLLLLTRVADHVRVGSLWRPLLLAEALVVALWALAWALYRSLPAGALVASCLCFLVLAFDTVETATGLSRGPALAVMLAVVLVVAVAAPAVDRRPSLVAFSNLFAILVVAMSVGQLALAGTAGASRLVLPETPEVRPPPEAERPDVYLIVLDGYASQTTLRRIYDADNGPFVDSLRALGFRVSPDALANYSQTQTALASLLNLDYLQAFGLGEGSGSVTRRPLRKLLDENVVMKVFERLGYTTVAFRSGYPPLDMSDAHVRVGAEAVSLLEWWLLDGSLLPEVLPAGALPDPYEEHRRRIEHTLRDLPRVAAGEGPKFVFAHLLAPHPPFVFDERGGATTPGRAYSISDGTHYLGSPEEYVGGYRAQSTFVARRVLEAVEGVLAESPRRPVIAILGDHGPGAFLDQNRIESTDVAERMGILSALLLPEGSGDPGGDDLSPVNVFRTILRRCFGADLPPLEARSYFSTWPRPLEFHDVTERLHRETSAAPVSTLPRGL